MKRNKVLFAATILGAMGFAGAASAANMASQVFTWSGTVPVASTQNGWIIKTPQGGDIAAGSLVFATDKQGVSTLVSSTDLAFSVFAYDDTTTPAVGDAAVSYTFELTSLAVNSDGLASEQSGRGFYDLKADGISMRKGTAVSKASGGTAVLKVAPSGVALPDNKPNPGDSVDVQASIMVTAAA